ncbi:hypothetical protein B0T18DRAFT_385458 [Schizothecium vesticola]|uniref:Uncharacterized protein n=1 Tax=Schizothecium vesticola TaxID=314040 RepID=A0AA40F8Y3_9PEZI|nr:hypothetical protein B0T18DRAFT_385458 [Schizothecium vesticola]
MVSVQEDNSRRGALDSSSKPSGKLSIEHHPYTGSGSTGLLTPSLPSPSPRSHAEESSHGTTPPRETDATHGVRLPPISELLKLVPSPAIQLPAPLRQPNWSPMNGAPTPDYTPQPSPTCLYGPQTFANLSDQPLPLPPIIQNQSRYPSPPASHWTQLPPRKTTDPSLPLKRRRDDLREDHRPSPPPKRRRDDYRENRRRNSTPSLWVQPEASLGSASSFVGLATPPPAREDDNTPHYLSRQSVSNFCAQPDSSQTLIPYPERLTAPLPQKKKKENTPYTQEQEFFIRYFVVDLGYSWEVVQEHYMLWFPAIHRTVGALTCEYYRTNKQVPVIEDGLLVLGRPRKPKEELSKRKYRGFRYVCKEQQCRKDKIQPLLAIFPEEYEDPTNRWIQPEHRGKGREAAERRREQRVRETRRWTAKL